uniref:Uncharacterized protein n=1 Tax=Trichobilharzia regenti TaxID=157069 RepID=A0AA85K6Z1_TRIRE|nr:unnamed protein product [Trichobilharzia regenti]
MIRTNSQNFMPDRPWPGLTTTALPAAVSQGRSDKYATEAHQTKENKQKQAACDRPQAVVPWALWSRNQLPRCGQPGSNKRPHNPKCTQNLSNPHLSLSSSSSLLPCLPPTDAAPLLDGSSLPLHSVSTKNDGSQKTTTNSLLKPLQPL